MYLSEKNNISVNGTVISQDNILAEMQYHPADTVEEARYSAAEALVIRQLLLQRAQAKDAYGQSLDEQNEEVVIESLLASEVAIPESSEEEIKRYFDNNRARFSSEPLLEASHILLAVSAKDSAARKAVLIKAESLLKKIQQNPHIFASEAENISACSSRKTAGSLGQLSKGSTVPEFERQIFALEEGLCSTPIESRYGYHIVRVDRKIAGKPLPFEMVREQIVSYLQHRVERRAFRHYLQELMEAAEITGIALDAALSTHVQ